MSPKILFLCTGNSCRSQMAEGWARKLLTQEFESFSAGTHPQGVNQMAVRAMKECGVDISGHTSKSLESLKIIQFDFVVTVCDRAADSCPTPPAGTKIVHAPFDDPPHLAANAQTDDEAMQHYRRVRDEIKIFVLALPSTLAQSK